MKKIIIYFVIATMILTVGVSADSQDTIEKIKDFIKEKGINLEEANITEVDFDDLPEEVDIEKVDDTNIIIYEVDYGAKPLFVIAASDDEFKKDIIPVCDVRSLLNFGFSGEMNESGFLNTATGVRGSSEKGYVMMRKGSITAVSTNLEVIKEGAGKIEIIIYKNAKAVRFGNNIDASSAGVKKDYDIQSKDAVIFEPGDVIFVYAKVQEEIICKDIISMIEITTN